jgi:hypothetical protein
MSDAIVGAVTPCMLGRELTDCPLKRVGCGSLYDALMHVMPPFHIRIFVREQLVGDRAAQDWLRRLDDVMPQTQPAARTREWWR